VPSLFDASLNVANFNLMSHNVFAMC
jgi:hypothetical protein